MKTKFFLIFNFIAAFAIAQTQMRYLPMQDKYIDFGQAGTSSNVVSLPTHNPGYQGEKPSYCQQIVYDRNSNNNQILFFIRDNHIYNKYGKAMTDVYLGVDALFFPELVQPLSDIIENYSYANRNFSDYQTLIDDNITSDESKVLSPKIIVAPVPGSCYDFFVILSIYTLEGGDGSSHNDLFLFKIRYINEDEIEFSKYFTLAQYIPNITQQTNGVSINAALSDYRSSTNDYILAVNVSKQLYTFNLHGSNDFDNPSTNISQISNTTLCSMCGNDEENFKEEAEIIPMYSHGQLTKYRVAYPLSVTNEIRYYITELSTSGTISNSYYFTENPSCGEGCFSTPKGLEFSPNGSYLYYTWTGQSAIKYVNISSLINGDPETTYKQSISIGSDNATYYKYSHIELGRDGKLCYIRTTGDGSTDNATLSTFSTPNSPTSGTWASNVLSINNLKMQHYISSTMQNYTIPSKRNIYKHYVISDQLDGSNYENYFSTVGEECCFDHYAFNLLNTGFNSHIVKINCSSTDDCDIEVQNGYSGTWTATSNPFNTGGGNTVYLKNNLYVDAGATVTISGLTIKFMEGKGLYMEPGSGSTKGARVTLTSSTKLTAVDACGNDKMWLGVRVIGNSTNQFPQTTTTQTKLVMNGSSIIEYADTAAKLIDGGIIQATGGVTFRDNIFALDFAYFINTGSYAEQNASYFTSCYFTTDNDLYDLKSQTPVYFVNMWYNKGILFTTCQFKNTTTVASHAFGTRGCGIIATGSNLITRGTCGSSTIPCPYADQTPTLFQSLDWAFKARIGTSIEAQKCKFDNNFKGLYIQAYTGNVKVLENYFNTADYTATNNDTTYGFYLHGCPYYKVEENKFENGKAGMFVNNCHLQTTDNNNYKNYIYRNTFNNLINSSPYDNAVAVTALNYNNDKNYGYGDYGTIIKCNNFTNSKFNISVIGTSSNLAGICHNQGDGGALDTCPANNTFDHAYCGTFSTSDFYVNYTNINYVYFYPNNGGNNYQLQCYSPLQSSPPFNPVINPTIVSVPGNYDKCPSHLISGGGGTSSNSSMIAQYNSMLSIDDQLEAKENELSALSVNENINSIDEKKQEIIALHVKRGEIFKNLLGNALTGNSAQAVDTLCFILQNEKGFDRKLIYIQLLLDMNKLNDASDLINQLRGEADNYPEKAKQEMLDMLNLMEVMLTYRQNGTSLNTLKEIVSKNEKFLTSVASQPSHGGSALAMALLSTTGVQNYKELILLPEPGENQEKMLKQAPGKVTQNNLALYPNPANSMLYLESTEEISGEVTIYNSLGKPVKSVAISGSKITLPLDDLPSGLYILKINNNKLRFSIVK